QKGPSDIRQKEVNAPNLPLFANGKGAFIGDYIDVAGQAIVATNDSNRPYKWNVGGNTTDNSDHNFTTSGLPPVFYVSWTDNRDGEVARREHPARLRCVGTQPERPAAYLHD